MPPEEQLTAPPTAPDTLENFAEQATQVPVSSWLVVARNRRVNRDWEALLLRAPENARRCYQDLSTAPMVRKPKRVFPLKGKRYLGAWEYEVTSSDRVFYVPDEEKRKVLVYSGLQVSQVQPFGFVCVAAAKMAAATQTFGVPHTAAIRYTMQELIQKLLPLLREIMVNYHA